MGHKDKEERSAYNREYRKRNPDKCSSGYDYRTPEENRAYALSYYHRTKNLPHKVEQRQRSARKQQLKQYGLTLEQYDLMVLEREGRCDICSATPEKLVIDHCHDTDIIRGLLCSNCNVMLGMAKDNVDILEKAKGYLYDRNPRS